uniref:Amino acid transporter transmembrane domain-containing protein n=1 Tax=Acrobeloides nanus TaxID=290746 RepID=A0A914EJW6_9BILA
MVMINNYEVQLHQNIEKSASSLDTNMQIGDTGAMDNTPYYNNSLLQQLNGQPEKEKLSFGYSCESIPQYGSKVPVFKKENDEDEEIIIDGDFEREKGLGWFIAGLIIVGELAGGGIVALPTAMIQTQFYPGLVLVVFMSFVLSFTAYCLGQGWAIMLRLFPEYRSHCRKPYSEIGYRALGPAMRTIVSIFIDTTLFGICVVFLLLASKNIQDFISASLDVHVSYCILILAVACCLLPMTFLKSPKDFW